MDMIPRSGCPPASALLLCEGHTALSSDPQLQEAVQLLSVLSPVVKAVHILFLLCWEWGIQTSLTP